MDFSGETIRRAISRHRDLRFIHVDVHGLPLAGPFDVIIQSDLLNHLWDVQPVLEQVARIAVALSGKLPIRQVTGASWAGHGRTIGPPGPGNDPQSHT